MSTGSCDPCGWPGENILGKHMDRPYPIEKQEATIWGYEKKHIWNIVFFPFVMLIALEMDLTSIADR